MNTYEDYGGSGVIAWYTTVKEPYARRYIYKDSCAVDYNYCEKKKNPPFCPCCGAPTKPNLDNCEYCEVYF